MRAQSLAHRIGAQHYEGSFSRDRMRGEILSRTLRRDPLVGWNQTPASG